MNLPLKQAISEALRDYLKEHNLTQSDLSKRSGVRKEYINEIIKEDSSFTYNAGNGNVNPIPDKHFLKLAETIGFKTQKSYWELKQTPQLAQILSVLEDAKENGTTAVLIGGTGTGKTYITDLFIKHHPADAFKITVGNSDSLGDILDKILDTLKLPYSKTKSKKIRDIALYMKDQKHNGLTPILIFDEAENMKQPSLCAIKELYDNLNHYCALVLIGTDQLTRKIEALKKRNKEGIPQLYRRIKFGIRELYKIDTSYREFLEELEDKALIKFLQMNCDNYGELHDVLVPLRREADRLGIEPSEELAKQILNLI